MAKLPRRNPVSLMAWCLLPAAADEFLAAIRDGRLDPEKLIAMSSKERRAAFAEIVGAQEAHEVNAQFESKLLLKDQKRGLANWARKIGGLSEPARRDILDKINKLDRVLQPADEQSFLADLAAKKLGVGVTSEEAKEIFELSQKAERLKAEITAAGKGDYASGWTKENGIAYGRARQALLDRIESLKPRGHTLANNLINLLNFPKSALTSVLHWSAPFVQGWGMISTPQWRSGLVQMFQYFLSENHYQDLHAYIISHPYYENARVGKIGLTDIGDKLSTREEAIQSSLLQDANQWLSKMVGIPNLIEAWSRSFTGFLNYIRFNRYTQLLDAAKAQGHDIGVGSEVSNNLAKVVNNFTGRGELGEGDKYAQVGPLLNTLFFSPRKIVATVEMFNPVAYAKLDPFSRQVAAKQLAGSLIATGAVLTLAKIAGAQVTMDPRSSDFAKVNIGGEKFDMTGGNASYLRFLARLTTGQYISASGKVSTTWHVFGAELPARAAALAQFSVGKLSPVASVIATSLFGKNEMGDPFSMTQEASDALTPIVIDSYIKYWENNPDDTAAMIPALSALLGVGLESPLAPPPPSKSGMDVWGDPLVTSGTPRSWRDDPVNKEAQAVGLYPTFPMETIRKVPLTTAQDEDYIHISGNLAHMRLAALIQSQGWERLPVPVRKTIMQDTIRSARRAAADQVMLKSQGSANDIIAKAMQAKMAASTDLEPVR